LHSLAHFRKVCLRVHLLLPTIARVSFETQYRGTSLIRNSNYPWDHRRVLGIGLLQGPRRRQFLMSKAPL